ncbi:uncharacterized protein LOC141917326 [Strix aluco]|uniref:uncharacterized protein LOC141917326 n=1 Tax=Strix aluco TaxID=111821 RepID=UPI003DA5ACA2
MALTGKAMQGTYGEDPEEEEYKCGHCGKVFTSRRHMTRHQRIHRGEKTYVCQDCRKSFRESAYLLSHQRVHTKEKPFSCTTCGKRFSWRSNLKTHQRIHTGERPYACSHCKKSFRQSNDLRRHERAIHGGIKRTLKCSFKGMSAEDPQEGATQPRSSSREKEYKCEHCGKVFTCGSSLKCHRWIHAGERPYSWSHCRKKFLRRYQVASHQEALQNVGGSSQQCNHAPSYPDPYSYMTHLGSVVSLGGVKVGTNGGNWSGMEEEKGWRRGKDVRGSRA